MSEELIGIETVRALGYKLLSVLYGQPHKDWQEKKVAGDLKAVLDALSIDTGSDANTLKEILDNTINFTDLQVSHAKLFVGPYRLLVPPYGSVYLEEGRRTMGDSTMAALDFYGEVGVDISDKAKEVPDHIRVQLEMMYYLLAKEGQALDESNEEAGGDFAGLQQRFFQDYLITWAPLFARELEINAENDFYACLARVTSAFLAKEKENILQ